MLFLFKIYTTNIKNSFCDSASGGSTLQYNLFI
jgi:hypothetical protein